MMSAFVKDEDGCMQAFEALLVKCESLDNVVDPETEPYKSRYEARTLMEKFLENHPEEEVLRARLMIRIGINKYLTEENTDAERDMLAGMQKLEEKETWNKLQEVWSAEEKENNNQNENKTITDVMFKDCGSFLDLMNGYNYMGILWSHRADGTIKAKNYLERACALYENSMDIDFGKSSDAREELYTNTMFFLAQVYTSLGEQEKGAQMCTVTLRRQREFNLSYEPVRWARDAVGLAFFHFVAKGTTRIAAHYISAAYRAIPAQEENEPEEIACVRADADRAQGSLYQEILKHAYMNVQGDDDLEPLDNWITPHRQMQFTNADQIDFESEKDDIPPTAQSISNFETARDAFKKGNGAFERAKKYYVLEGFTTDHVKILQGQSRLYKYLAHFENDPKRIAAMHQRRIALLETMLNKLNEEVYAVLHQEISYELGEASREVLAANIQRAMSTNTEPGSYMIQKPQDVKRVNLAAMDVVKFYKHFIKSFEAAEKRDQENGHAIAEPHECVPYLQCFFWLAHSYHKMIPPDPTSIPGRILLLNESLKYFQLTFENANKRLGPDSPYMEQEREISRQMVDLLPEQIRRLQHGEII